MILLYAKYAFIFWLLVGSVDQHSLKLLQQLSTDDALLIFSACTADCLQTHRIQSPYEELLSEQEQRMQMEQRQNQDFVNCFDSCKNAGNANRKEQTNKFGANTFRKISENFNLQLICRTDRSLSFRIDLNENLHYNGSRIMNETNSEFGTFTNNTITPIYETSNERSFNLLDVVYIVKINQAVHAKESIVYLSDDNYFMVDQLKQNMTYNLTVLAMHANMQYSMIAQDELFTTLRRGFHPNAVTGVEIVKFVLNAQRPLYVTACMQWKPSADKNCFYDILYFSVEKIEFDEPIEYRDPRKLYRYDIVDLEFSGQYKIGVRSINIFNKDESEVAWLDFVVPPCLYWYKDNYSLCAPAMPTGLRVIQRHYPLDSLSLNISWDEPDLLPDNYTLRVLDLYLNGTHLSYELPKGKHGLYIPNVKIRGPNFGVLLTAHSKGGNTTIDEMYMKKPLESDRDNAVMKLVFFLIVSICSIVLFMLTLFCSRESKLNLYKERCQELENSAMATAAQRQSNNEEYETTTIDIFSISDLNETELDAEVEEIKVKETLSSNDETEVNHTDVELHEILGEGAFGLVRRGRFKKQDVAVKMLRENPSPDDILTFRREIEFMKSVGKHPNVIGLMGHCTTEKTTMMMLIEYCSLGNLIEFLRKEYQFRLQQKAKLTFEKTTDWNKDDNMEKCTNQNKIDFFDTCPDNEKSHMEDELKIQSMCSTSSSATPPTSIDMRDGIHFDDLKTQNDYGIIFDLSNVKEDKSSLKFTFSRKEAQILDDMNILTGQEEGKRLDTILEDPNECEVLSNTKKKGRHLLQTVENREYFKQLDDDDTTSKEPLQETDLLFIARQVAVGMEFLSKNKIVHRDLAARNILVAADRTIKIADFGLSRDIYHENVYKKTSGGKLPIKWLAIESLTHQVYTTKSDVWSFGILLYEIMTLGSSPYPTVATGQLISMLQNGYRNEQPPDCSDDIYAVMQSCWKAAPSDRPTFSELKIQLSVLLNERGIKNFDDHNINTQEHVNMDDAPNQNKINTSITNETSDESTPYLQPIN